MSTENSFDQWGRDAAMILYFAHGGSSPPGCARPYYSHCCSVFRLHIQCRDVVLRRNVWLSRVYQVNLRQHVSKVAKDQPPFSSHNNFGRTLPVSRGKHSDVSRCLALLSVEDEAIKLISLGDTQRASRTSRCCSQSPLCRIRRMAALIDVLS